MKAVVHDRYGPPAVLRLAEVPSPVPTDDEVLVRVHATTVNRTDCGMRKADPPIVRLFSGLLRPKQRILGSELAGEVAAVGSAVTRFQAGDLVFGVNADRFGAHAELVCVREDAPLALMPEGLGFVEAAAVSDGLVLAVTCLRWAGVGEGTRLLVYGASGSIGTAGVQLAKHLGAHVTAVCGADGVDLVRSLGADEVIERDELDWALADEAYDVVFDAVGKLSFRRCRRSMVRGGTFADTDLGVGCQVPLLAMLTRVTRMFGTRRVLLPLPKYRKEEILLLKDLLEAGRYRAVVDRCYPLEQVVEATEYVESEQKLGNVVLTVV